MGSSSEEEATKTGNTDNTAQNEFGNVGMEPSQSYTEKKKKKKRKKDKKEKKVKKEDEEITNGMNDASKVTPLQEVKDDKQDQQPSRSKKDKKTKATEPQKVTLKMKANGSVKEVLFDSSNITGEDCILQELLTPFEAREVEEAFHVVRCHLEGNDHSARFPDKTTGLYEKIDPRVQYTVFGHAYDPDQIWKARSVLRAPGEKLDIPKGKVVKEGKLFKFSSALLGSGKWSDVEAKLEYGVMQLFKPGQKKPYKEIELGHSRVATDNNSDRSHAFQIIGKAKTYKLAALNHNDREDWMLWITAVVDVWRDDSESDSDNNTDDGIQEPQKDTAKIEDDVDHILDSLQSTCLRMHMTQLLQVLSAHQVSSNVTGKL